MTAFTAWTLLTALPAVDEPQMNTAGWVFLGLGWVCVTGLALWCFKRVMGSGPTKG